MSNGIMEIAARMRELREICDYTQESLAQVLGITAAQYAQYESGSVDIPISVLLHVATTCNVELSALLTGGEPKLHVYNLTRAGTGMGIERRKEYRYQSLAFNFGDKIAEPFLVTAGTVLAGTPLVLNTHEGQEFDYLIEGCLRMVIDGNEMVLNPGDSIYFNSAYPHGMQAVGDTEAKFLAIVL